MAAVVSRRSNRQHAIWRAFLYFYNIDKKKYGDKGEPQRFSVRTIEMADAVRGYDSLRADASPEILEVFDYDRSVKR
jgi:hypothetical protein